MMFPTILAYRN